MKAFLKLILTAPLLATAAEIPTKLTVNHRGSRELLILSETELGIRLADGVARVAKVAPGLLKQKLAETRAPKAGGAAKTNGHLLFYPRGEEKTAFSRRWLLGKVTVEAKAWVAPAALAKKAGAASWTTPAYSKNHVVLDFEGDGEAALAALPVLRAAPGVLSAEVQLAAQQSKRFIPNDPFFAHSASNPGYQWHLRNTGDRVGVAGIDVNVVPAWDSWRGAGIRIGIVDDGVDLTHPDLVANLDLVNDYDWNGEDDTPQATLGDDHGNACAGVAAARGNNGIGVSGAAPEATIVGLRLISGPSSDQMEAEAINHQSGIIQVKSNSWGPQDTGNIQEAPGPLAAAALENAVTTGRSGLGSILLWAGGNGRRDFDDSNYDGYANSIYTIAVGATGDHGRVAGYSERGANLLISAPSNGNGQEITTTDLVGALGYNSGGVGDYDDADYTNTFGGTSSATPLAAGCVALLLQSKPTLGWRDVMEILIRSASPVDVANPKWFTNGAGIRFNEDYGAGLLNANAAINLAASWVNLPQMVNRVYPQLAVNQSIPATGALLNFQVPAGENLRVEQLTLAYDLSHNLRGKLRFELTSPSGATSVLADVRQNDAEPAAAWKFSGTQFWGEHSVGTWQLRIRNASSTEIGLLSEATLSLFGTPAGAALPPPVFTGTRRLRVQAGTPVATQLPGSNNPTWAAANLPTGLTLSTQGQLSGSTSLVGSFTVPITLSNTTGNSTGNLLLDVVQPNATLADAVELPAGWINSPGGWTRVTNVSSDAVDSARSGTIGSYGASEMIAEVAGPGQMQFQWKVSSEQDYDFLRVFIDGVLYASISGEVDWQLFQTELTPGTHEVKWVYSKDTSGDAGVDAGWVDAVQVAVADGPPIIGGPTTAQGGVGLPFSYQIVATQYPTLFTASGLPDGLSINGASGQISGTPTLAGTFLVTISASNNFGSDTASLTVTVLDTITLAVALDQPTEVFTSFGAPWRGQLDTTHDGVDAAQAASIGSSGTTQFSSSFIGSRELSFWWKVSSEQGYDYLELWVDGALDRRISGAVDWQSVQLTVNGAGFHEVAWIYTKDGSVDEGQDTAWVDELVFTSSNGLPTITSAHEIFASLGDPLEFQLTATESPTGYVVTGLPGGLTVDSVTGVISGFPAAVGVSQLVATVTNSFGPTQQAISLVVLNPLDALAVALNTPGVLPTRTGPNWFTQTSNTHDGIAALQSGANTHGGSSSLSVPVVGPGVVSFWWRVSSETDYDFLRVYVDDVFVQEITGETAWAQVQIVLTPGAHSLRWTYSKDESESFGADAGWVDELVLPIVDSDGDGFTNITEAWFGTNALSFASVPNLTFRGQNLTFPSVAGRVFRLWESNDLVQWTQRLVPASGPLTTVPIPAGDRFYFKLSAP